MIERAGVDGQRPGAGAPDGVDGVADRMRFPVLGSGPDMRAIRKSAPLTVGASKPEIREQEAKAAGEILGLHVRGNLGFRDGFLVNDEKHQLEIIKVLRKYQPEIVFANAIADRHPDHGKHLRG